MPWKRVLLIAAAAVAVLLGVALWMIGGPSMLLGMLRYDERREGAFKPGDPAPDVSLVRPEGRGRVNLADHFGKRPLVIIFGSYT
jgi:hypothetical protein